MALLPRNRRWLSPKLLFWLGVVLAGLAATGIVISGILLATMSPPSKTTEAVFQLPAPQETHAAEASPGASTRPAAPASGHDQTPETVPSATSKPEAAKPEPPKPETATSEPGAAPAPAATHQEAPVAAASPEQASTVAPGAPAGGGGGGGALAPAPDPQLIERTADGVLPVIGPDGRMPWQVYARPFTDPQHRPRIAVVINGLGLSDLATQNAIEKLPPQVSLGFSPYAKRLGDWIQLARTVGHEVLLDVPLEPDDPENQDPGPDTLLTTLAPSRNIARLHAVMGRVTGYVGLMPSRSDRFANVPAALRPVLEDLRARGLLVLDTSSTTLAAAPPSLVRVGADLVLDSDPTRASIEQRLADLEAAAKRNGTSAGIGRALPVTLAAVSGWAEGLDKRGFVLAPVTAIARR